MSPAVFGNRRLTIIALILGGVIALMGMTSKGPFISGSQRYSQEIATSSAVTYLSLRLINAAISFAEEVEVGGSIIAVNGSAHPFKVLEPIDDAIERLSTAIFMIGAISGIMAVILPVLGNVTFVMIGVAMMVLAGLDLAKINFPGRPLISNLFSNIASLGLMGFLVVLAFSISSWFAEGLSNRAWGKYEQTLAGVAEQMPSLSEEELLAPGEVQADNVEEQAELTEIEIVPEADPQAEDAGWGKRALNKIKGAGKGAAHMAGSAASSVGDLAHGTVESVKDAVSGVSASYGKARDIVVILSTQSDDLVNALMGVLAAFVFKTIVCPLLILAGLWKLAGGMRLGRSNGRAEAT